MQKQQSMDNNSVMIQNTSRDEMVDMFRQVLREELTALQAKEPDLKYRTRKEVCKLLNISLPTLAEYTRSGIIIGKKIGSRILYEEASVQAAVRNVPVVKHKRVLPSTVKPLA